MSLPAKADNALPGPRCEDSARGSRAQRVPSFKLLDDDRARSKRFRNRAPSAVGRSDVGGGDAEMPMPSPLIESARASPYLGAPGPRRVSSFSLTSDVFRMAHTSSWGSGVGSNMFGFGPASVEGEGEDIVQRLDDASFNDLNFLTMEGVGPSDTSGKVAGEQSGAGIDVKAYEKRDGGRSFNRHSASTGHLCVDNTCDRPQSTVSKEEMLANPIVDRTGSARDILSRPGSVRDVLRSGGMSRGESNLDVFGTNDFGLDEGLPIFSSSMEEYLNHQLEAAEQSLGSSAVAMASYGRTSSRGGGAVDGDTDEEKSVRMGSARAGGSSHYSLAATTCPAEVKSERDRFLCGPDGIRRIEACSKSVRVKAEELKPKNSERRPKDSSISPPRYRQHHDSDEEAESSHSEYEPPAPRKKKTKKRRSKERVAAATAAAATAAANTSTPSAEASGGAPARAVNSVSTVLRRSTPKRQTSEDVAARLPLEVLECFYHLPLNVAAVQLDVSLTMLKKLCRTYGVKRWPHRQVSSLDKTTSKLEEKIKARNDGGKDAPSLIRKLAQAKKRRSVIIKTASAGLDATVLNSIFTCRPGAIDEDLLLSSTNVAATVDKIHSALEVDHRDSGSDSKSDDDSDDSSSSSSRSSTGGGSSSGSGSCSGSGSDRDLDRKDARSSDGAAVKSSLAMPSKMIPFVQSALAIPSSSARPPAIAKSLSAPPPAFEPGGRPKNAASKDVAEKKGDVPRVASKRLVANRKADAKHAKKAERTKTSAARTAKVAASTSKGQKFVQARSVAPAGRHGSTPSKSKSVASAVAAAAAVEVLPSTGVSEGPRLDSYTGGLGIKPKAGGSGGCSAAFPSGSSLRSRAQATGYSGSGVFGMRLHHQPSGMSKGHGVSTIPSGAVLAARSPRRAFDPSHPRAASGVPSVQQATRTPARVESVGKRALGYGERHGGASGLQWSPPQLHIRDAGAESPMTTGAPDGFALNLDLEPPSRGPDASAPQSTPPPPPYAHRSHPYLLHHQFPHHRPHHHHSHLHPSFHNLSWVGRQYPWPAHHQPYGFPVELMSPIDTRFRPPKRGPGCQGSDAFSKVDDSGQDGSDRGARLKSAGTAEAHNMTGGAASGAAVAAASPSATAAVDDKAPSQDTEPRRTGFMSYLLHQAPQSPPFSSSSSPSAPPSVQAGDSAASL